MSIKDEPKPLNFIKALSQRFQQVPAWRDLAEACNEVLSDKVEKPRRELAKVRDSVSFRKGDVVEGLRFSKTKGFVVKDHSSPDPDNGFRIPAARVVNVLHNNIYDSDEDTGIDAMEVEFFVQGKKFNWVLPISAPKERSLMIQNGYMVGFDFFNTKLSDEDYQRLYEFVSMYWPEGGTDNFLRFISFIKNLHIQGIPLWSYDDGTDSFPVLEEKRKEDKAAYEGGKWYQTSHVELRYNPLMADNVTQPVLEDLEELFFLFAPIHLVLERIVAAVDMFFEFFSSVVGQEMELYYAKYQWKYDDATIQHPLLIAGDQQEILQAVDRYEWPALKSIVNMTIQSYIEETHYNKETWTPEWLDAGQVISTSGQLGADFNSKIEYKWPILNMEATLVGQGSVESIEASHAEYKIEIMRPIIVHKPTGIIEYYELAKKIWDIPVFALAAHAAHTFSDQIYMFYSYIETNNYGNGYDDYPEVNESTVVTQVAWQYQNLIFGNKEYVDRYANTPHYINTSFNASMFVVACFYSKVRSSKRL